MRKVLNFWVIAGLLLLQIPAQAAYRMTPRQAIYYHAHTGNLYALYKINSMGYHVDLLDSSGNSALCEAILRQDQVAVNTLLSAGANIQTKCMQRIPKSYRNHMGIDDNGQLVAGDDGLMASISASPAAETAMAAAVIAGGVVGLSVLGGNGKGKTPNVANDDPDDSGKNSDDSSGGNSGENDTNSCGAKVSHCKEQDCDGKSGSKWVCTLCEDGYTLQNNTCVSSSTNGDSTSCAGASATKVAHCLAHDQCMENDTVVKWICFACEEGYTLKNNVCVMTDEDTATKPWYELNGGERIFSDSFLIDSETEIEPKEDSSQALILGKNGVKITNYGTITGNDDVMAIDLKYGDNQVENNGKITGNMYIGYGDGKNTVTNTGEILGKISMWGDEGIVENNTTGTISVTSGSAVDLSANSNLLYNYGGIYVHTDQHATAIEAKALTSDEPKSIGIYNYYKIWVTNLSENSFASTAGIDFTVNSVNASEVVIRNAGNLIVSGINGRGIDGSTWNLGTDLGISTIDIENSGSIDAKWGIYVSGDADIEVRNAATGTINATYGLGVYGPNATGTNYGTINAISMGLFGGTIINEKSGIINADYIGMLADTGLTAINRGTINISGTGTGGYSGVPSGICARASTVINTIDGTINVTNGHGIYAYEGSIVENYGTIAVDGSMPKAPIHAEGSGTTVYNAGTLKIGDSTQTGNIGGDWIELVDGAQFVNAGTYDSDTGIKLSSTKVMSGSKTTSKKFISGLATVASDTVMGGNKSTYIEKDMFVAPDTTNLKLKSESALFDAKLADNGHDVVMTMKGFNSVTDNATLAQFLANNYALGNNEVFYNKLKSIGKMNALTDSLNKLTGKDMLSRFNFEDMTMMRELNYDMNEKLFHNKEQHFSVAGSVSPMAFKGDSGSSAKYSLYNKRNGSTSIGLGVAFTDVRSDNSHDKDNRSETSYQLILPIGYKTHGFNLVASPRIGYARGTYDRTGFDEKSYDGTIEKRMFGLMNEARYPITVGNWRFEPAAEFNILGYQQKGREDAKEFALKIQNQNTYSVEGGIGLYATREDDFGDNGTLKLTTGVVAYHEFADPYKLRVGMDGMNGDFTLRDEKRSDNRAVVRAGFNYDKEDLSLYGSLISYIDREWRTNAKTGINWKF